jgi:hypothetical protein
MEKVLASLIGRALSWLLDFVKRHPLLSISIVLYCVLVPQILSLFSTAAIWQKVWEAVETVKAVLRKMGWFGNVLWVAGVVLVPGLGLLWLLAHCTSRAYIIDKMSLKADLTTEGSTKQPQADQAPAEWNPENFSWLNNE